jgi:hypothetical protein
LAGELTSAWWDGTAWLATVENRDTIDSRALAVVRSADGLTWQALGAPPARAGRPAGDLPNDEAGLSDAQGASVVWQVWDENSDPWVPSTTLIRTSADRAGWSPIPGFDGSDAWVAVGARPAQAGAPWALAGQRDPDGPNAATVWIANPDGGFTVRTLTPKAGESSPVISGMAHAGDGFVVVARVGRKSDGSEVIGSWTSGDGTSWSRMADVPEPMEVDTVLVADGPHGPLMAVEGVSGTVTLLLGTPASGAAE